MAGATSQSTGNRTQIWHLKCSWRHYSQSPQGGNKPNIHQLMMGKQLRAAHTAECYLAINRHELLTHTTTWLNHRNMLRESSRTQRPRVVWFHLCKMPRTGKSIGTEHRLRVAGGRGRGAEESWRKDPGFPSGVMKCSGTSQKGWLRTLWIYWMPLNCPL